MFGMQGLYAKLIQIWPLVNLMDDDKKQTNIYLWFHVPIHSTVSIVLPFYEWQIAALFTLTINSVCTLSIGLNRALHTDFKMTMYT